MTFFTASVQTIIIRFFLMMAIIIGSLFGGVPFLGLLALPMFLAAMTGVSFGKIKLQSASASTEVSINKRTAMASH